MPWRYEQSTGKLYDENFVYIGIGYSGQPPHTNIPENEGIENWGPIPTGDWVVSGLERTSSKHGPFVLVLSPDPTTRIRVAALGRDPSSFRIHGERVTPPPGFASEGCIILPRSVRELIWSSIDHDIQVVKGG